MEMSENINELALSLSMSQAELKNVVCDTKGHGYMYAKLDQYVEVFRPVLSKHGLAVSQMVGTTDNGKTQLTTLLMHKSGQWIKSTVIAPDAVLQGGAGKNPIQVEGSKITYLRRYALAAMLCISDGADDDANGYHAHAPAPTPTPAPAITYGKAHNSAPAPVSPVAVLKPMPDDFFDQVMTHFKADIMNGTKNLDWLKLQAAKRDFTVTTEQAESFDRVRQVNNPTNQEIRQCPKA